MKRIKRKKSGFIFVVSGPSGSGKTTLAAEVLRARELIGRVFKSVSFTTRPIRSREKDGKDYFFVSKKDFRELLKAKKILEWTKYLGYYYATPRDFVEGQLKKNRHLILCLDLKGSRKIKRLYPGNTVTVFVMPPSLGVLKNRIKNRCKHTTAEDVHKRLKMARRELLAAERYDYCLLNKDLKQGVKELKGIILSRIAT